MQMPVTSKWRVSRWWWRGNAQAWSEKKTPSYERSGLHDLACETDAVREPLALVGGYPLRMEGNVQVTIFSDSYLFAGHRQTCTSGSISSINMSVRSGRTISSIDDALTEALRTKRHDTHLVTSLLRGGSHHSSQASSLEGSFGRDGPYRHSCGNASVGAQL